MLEWCESYGLNPNAVLKLDDLQGRKDVLPPVVKTGQLFTEVLDIFGKPARRFYETLQMAAKDENEKKEIEYLLSKEGKPKMRELMKETPTYADLMKLYPSTKLNLEYLLDHVPRIKPRLYSIASSMEMHKDSLHLCIVKDDWNTPSGKLRYGLCTRYLAGLSQGGSPDLVFSRVKRRWYHHFPTLIHYLQSWLVWVRVSRPSEQWWKNERSRAYAEKSAVRWHSSSGRVIGAPTTPTVTNLRHITPTARARWAFWALHSPATRRTRSTYKIASPKTRRSSTNISGNKRVTSTCADPRATFLRQSERPLLKRLSSAGVTARRKQSAIVTQMQIEGRYNIEAW